MYCTTVDINLPYVILKQKILSPLVNGILCITVFKAVVAFSTSTISLASQPVYKTQWENYRTHTNTKHTNNK